MAIRCLFQVRISLPTIGGMPEPTVQPQSHQTAARFGRDVLVNVLANLLAAALIYVIAVIAGAIPRNPTLFLISLTVLGLVAAGSLSNWSKGGEGWTRRAAGDLGIILLGLAGTCFAILNVFYWNRIENWLDLILAPLNFVPGIVATVWGSFELFNRQKR